MRSPYMDILEAAGPEPKEFIFPGRYDARIAASCVHSLAENYRRENVQIRQLGNILFVWIGQAIKISFTPPGLRVPIAEKRGRGRPRKRVQSVAVNGGEGIKSA